MRGWRCPKCWFLELPDSAKHMAIVSKIFAHQDVEIIWNMSKVTQQFENSMVRLLLDFDELGQGMNYYFCVLFA